MWRDKITDIKVQINRRTNTMYQCVTWVSIIHLMAYPASGSIYNIMLDFTVKQKTLTIELIV